jgi:quinoprotein dehydrogenase-associated probable ABC transporter substrate-binding protein
MKLRTLPAVLLLASLAACATKPKTDMGTAQAEPTKPTETSSEQANAPKPQANSEAEGNGEWQGALFKVCADPNNPPYSDKQGQGYENKIAELLAKDFGKKVEYFWFPQRMGFIRNTLKAQLIDSNEYRCDVIIGYPTGAEMVATTKPYYRSTYTIIYAKKRGFDDIKSQEDLANLPAQRRAKLKLAIFDSSPASTWMLKHGLVEHAIPYQTMTGDGAVNTAQMLEKDMKDRKLDMAIVWGPLAGWIKYHNKVAVELVPMHSEDADKEAKFEYPMSMAVRIPDKSRKAILNQLIDKNAGRINDILRTYHVPMVK